MRRLVCPVLLSLPLSLGSCFTADLDPNAASAFVCSNEEPIVACPERLTCINERCEAGDPPLVRVLTPEEAQPFQLADAEVGALRDIPVVFSGNLEIVAPSDANGFLEGHLEVFVDGVSVGTIEDGDLAAGIPFTARIPNLIGPHRVAVHALRNDGTRYDNPEAVERRLFWIDDGVTPLVGIRKPWPGDAFTLAGQAIEIEAVVSRFTLLPADPTGMPLPLTGHVHVYYDVDIDTCVRDLVECDPRYITTVIGDMPSQGFIAEREAPGAATLSVVLRNIDHSLFEFDADGDDGPTPPRIITDVIPLVREN